MPATMTAAFRHVLALAGVLPLWVGAPGFATAANSPEPAASSRGDQVARFVRIELSGPARILQLAEVWVIVAGQNVAIEGTASQSSTLGQSEAARAVDGNTMGDHTKGSVSHTVEGADPWWELDLGRAVPIDQVTVFNRTDCCGDRLTGMRVALLDEARALVWRQADIAAPAPRFDVAPFGAPIVTPAVTAAGKRVLQPAIDDAIERGVAFLRSTQMLDGSWDQHQHVHFGGQTALSLLTLIKAGVSVDDPAITAAREFLRANGSESTYGTGCLLMALEALGDEGLKPWATELAEQLMGTQGGYDAAGKHDGMWTYPLQPNTTVCLSNTQYAILGLRSAQRMGVNIPSRVFRKTLDDLALYGVESERSRGTSRFDDRDARLIGFQYRAEGGHGGASGSMTTAALAVLYSCRGAFGEAPPKRLEADLLELERGAWRWLDMHFAVEHNPGRPDSWHYYYLYGLERVGAFFERPTVGERDWYWDGARFLVGEQKPNGDWGDQTNTCFAVLFLKRATASLSGPTRHDASDVHIAEGADADVRWRGTGRASGTFWISGFGQDALAEVGGESALRVFRVEYKVNDAIVATCEGDASRPWRPADRYPVQLDLAALGKGRHEVGVSVQVIDPAPTAASTGYVTFTGPLLEVNVAAAPARANQEGDTIHADANLIGSARVVQASASSQLNDGHAPGLAVDGRMGTAWIAAKDDATPTWTVEFERPIRARRLAFAHADSELRYTRGHDRATELEVRINRDAEVLRFAVEPDDRRRAVIELPPGKQVRRLEVRVTKRAQGERSPGLVGFSEIELLADERRVRRR